MKLLSVKGNEQHKGDGRKVVSADVGNVPSATVACKDIGAPWPHYTPEGTAKLAMMSSIAA